MGSIVMGSINWMPVQKRTPVTLLLISIANKMSGEPLVQWFSNLGPQMFLD